MSDRTQGRITRLVSPGDLAGGVGCVRRGTFTDATDLQTAIRTYIDSYNERATPFSWTKTADELLGKNPT